MYTVPGTKSSSVSTSYASQGWHLGDRHGHRCWGLSAFPGSCGVQRVAQGVSVSHTQLLGIIIVALIMQMSHKVQLLQGIHL